MLDSVITDHIASAKSDGSFVASGFLLIAVLILSIKYMRLSVAHKQQTFRYSPEYKAARRSFNSRVKVQSQAKRIAAKPARLETKLSKRAQRLVDAREKRGLERTKKPMTDSQKTLMSIRQNRRTRLVSTKVHNHHAKRV